MSNKIYHFHGIATLSVNRSSCENKTMKLILVIIILTSFFVSISRSATFAEKKSQLMKDLQSDVAFHSSSNHHRHRHHHSHSSSSSSSSEERKRRRKNRRRYTLASQRYPVQIPYQSYWP